MVQNSFMPFHDPKCMAQQLKSATSMPPTKDSRLARSMLCNTSRATLETIFILLARTGRLPRSPLYMLHCPPARLGQAWSECRPPSPPASRRLAHARTDGVMVVDPRHTPLSLCALSILGPSFSNRSTFKTISEVPKATSSPEVGWWGRQHLGVDKY